MTKSKEPKPKVKQSETLTIKRSQINFAPYNPRKANDKVIDALVRNFKAIGFLGGIQWNKTTGNLIGGHQRLTALDRIHKYDGTKETDYDVKVEACEMDLKTEMEQNIFLNNKRSQGENDYVKMAEMLPMIDIESAALETADIEMIEAVVPNFSFGSNQQIKEDIDAIKPPKAEKTPKEKKAHVQNVKQSVHKDIGTSHMATHLTVTFKTYEEKAEWCSGYGINEDTTIITSDRFLKAISE